MIMLHFFLAALLAFSSPSLANAAVYCEPGQTFFKNLENLAEHIDENEEKIVQDSLSPANIIQASTLNTGDIVQTGDNEIKQIIATAPYKAKFLVYPNSEVKIFKGVDAKCGLELEIISTGKIVSTGEHMENNECTEIHTPEFSVTPVGTKYYAEVGALNDALKTSMEEIGQDYAENEMEEKISVTKGSIQVKLRRATSKSRIIKVTKATAKSKKQSRKKLAKTKVKSTNKKIAASKKINLKAGSSIKAITNNKTSKKSKTRVAEIEVIEPN